MHTDILQGLINFVLNGSILLYYVWKGFSVTWAFDLGSEEWERRKEAGECNNVLCFHPGAGAGESECWDSGWQGRRGEVIMSVTMRAITLNSRRVIHKLQFLRLLSF